MWNGKETWSVTTQMGITWKIQQSTPIDAHKVVFTLMSLQTLIPDLIDWTQECRLMLTKLTRHWCIRKRKWLYYLQWITEESGTLDVCNSLSGWSAWEGKLSGELGVHGGRASGVNYAGFPCKMAQGSAALYNGLPTCQAAWDAGLNLAGTVG